MASRQGASTEAVLALDQGSHASRACLYDRDGQLLARCDIPVGTRHPAPDRVEQDPLELADSLQHAAEEALAHARSTHPRLLVVAAGLAVQRSTLVCCEAGTLAPLLPALSWQDRRHAGWLARLAPAAARVRALTGLPLSAHYGASKLRWCLENVPAVRQAAQQGNLRALPLAAWLQARLARSEARVDAANASRTLLLDTARLEWSEELLDLFGLRAMGVAANALPPCVPTLGGFGTLRLSDSRAQRGGDMHVPLVALTGDQSAVPFATGTLAANEASLNIGTGAFLQQPLARRPADPSPLLGSVLGLFGDGPRYTLEGTVNGAGAAVSAFVAREALDEARAWAALETLADDVALPDALVATGGLGSPWWQPQAPTHWPEGGTPLARFAAVVESIAVLAALNVAEFARLGAAPTALRIAGGLSRSGFLARRLAAFTGLPVRRSAPDATARGAAALAMPEWGARWASLPPAAGGSGDDSGAAIGPPQGALATALGERYARLAAGYRALAAAAEAVSGSAAAPASASASASGEVSPR
jgi:glycerol kinase